jgi:hypothetical protein
MKEYKISKELAKRITICNGLGTNSSFGKGETESLKTIEHLGYVQLL